MNTITERPLEGSVFSPTTLKGVVERFHSISMRDDVPPCECVEADFGVVTAIVSDLGRADDGSIGRDCGVIAGGVATGFDQVELDGYAADGSTFGSRTVDDRTIDRIRRWSVGHGMPDYGPATSTQTAIAA